MKTPVRSKYSYWWQTSRPKTLLASVGPILLGSSLAASIAPLELSIFLATLCCSLMLQISVNIANDYFDANSGVDSKHRIGPQRATQSGLLSPKEMKIGLAACCSTAIILGLYLISLGGWPIFFLGAFSLLGVFSYSSGPFPLASHGLGEVAVIIFFGWIAVLGSCYLQSTQMPTIAFSLATSSGLLASAVMLINNLRDITTDKKANKITLAVRLGDNKTRQLFALIILLSLSIHIAASLYYSLYLLLPVILCAIPCYFIIQQCFILQKNALNKLLAHVVQVGFLYNVSVAVTWSILFAQ